MRTLIVTPRYGPTILGGAETLVRALALRGFRTLGEVEVATTCAIDHRTWSNDLEEGTAEDGGIPVRRFRVSTAEPVRHAWLVRKLSEGRRLTYLEELALLSSGVWSEGLQDFLERRGRDFDHIVFAPYLFGTTYWGTRAWPERSIVLPCLHDEPYAHLRSIREMLGSVAGCIFNSDAERRLAHRLGAVRAGGVVGMGFDPPAKTTLGALDDRIPDLPYLTYVGRLEEGKGVHLAVEHVSRYAAERRIDLRLVLLGDGPFVVPRHQREFVVRLGYVDEETKAAVLERAVALVNLSTLESFSIVLLEAWLRRTPAVVSARSPVMADHCAASGGGVAIDGYEGFARTVDRLLADPAWGEELGRRGQEYVSTEYSWKAVSERLARTMAGIATRDRSAEHEATGAG